MEGSTLQSANRNPFLRIGTRGSPLALVQARDVRRLLAEAHGVAIDDIAIEIIATAGDQSQASNRPMAEVGSVGLFSKEIEAQLLAGTIDIGVHSTKDMMSLLPEGLIMPVFLPRADVRDVFLSVKYNSLEELPEGAVVGTSSLRRRAQLLRVRPDLKMVEFRGNVGTRLEKLRDGLADATLLAAAGLIRMGQADQITQYLDVQNFPTAPAQGAIGIELRADDTRTAELVMPLNDAKTYAEVTAERAFLREMDGSCRTPIAALTLWEGENIRLRGQILSLDGSKIFDAEITGPASEGEIFGPKLARQLLDAAGPSFVADLRAG